MPFRLIGSYEFSNALSAFQNLIAISDREEIQTYDRILASRPEFTFYQSQTGATQGNNVANRQFRRDKLNDEILKKGLAWMMALARVELGATMSMYGDSDTPFEDLSDTNFDREAYLKILAIDFVEHMKALRSDEFFNKEILRRSRTVDFQTLSYLRRVKLVNDMLEAAAHIATESELAVLNEFHGELKKYVSRLTNTIRFQIAPHGNETQTQWSNTKMKRYGQKRVIRSSDIKECLNDTENRVTYRNPKGSSTSGSKR